MARRRGKETMVQCSYCGRMVPRSKCKVLYRKGLKVYVCPKCARYRSLRIIPKRKTSPSIRPP